MKAEAVIESSARAVSQFLHTVSWTPNVRTHTQHLPLHRR